MNQQGRKMKQIFEIKDKNIIDAMMSKAEYATLALCSDNSAKEI